ncbi:putative histidinol-phosphate transaminase [Helianthus annuus]|nr:putative histidinol-phosphate transaminase [Helianthus annuus]
MDIGSLWCYWFWNLLFERYLGTWTLALDVQKITEVIEREKPKIIFLTSPNNPDGSVINDDVLLKILDLPNLVVLDEAYIEFSGLESKMGWVKKHENLIFLRTFSKRAGTFLQFLLILFV